MDAAHGMCRPTCMCGIAVQLVAEQHFMMPSSSCSLCSVTYQEVDVVLLAIVGPESHVCRVVGCGMWAKLSTAQPAHKESYNVRISAFGNDSAN